MQRVRLLVIFAVVLLLSTSFACAQQLKPSGSLNDPAPKSPSIGISRTNADGSESFIPFKDLGLDDITLEQYLKQRRNVPQYQITSIDLTGTANDKNVKLTATIRIHIDEEFADEWVRVPVAIPEATLTASARYAGPGKATFDGQSVKTTGRRAWFIRGGGNHTLTLPLIRPLREQEHTKRRLALTLPPAGSSHIRLQIPDSDFRIESSAQSGATLSQTDGKSYIDAYGLGIDFKLNWERQPKTSISQLQLANKTEILADLSRTPIKLTAKQTVTAPRGSFEQLVVTLPRGMRVFDITESRDISADPFLKDYTVDETSTDSTQVTVYLNRPCSDSLRLNWDLEPVDPDIPGKLTFESFRVAGASAHSGEVEVIAPAGFEIVGTPIDARRTTVKSAFNSNQIATAYEFTSDRFRLMLDIREIEPTFSIAPTMQLTGSGDTLTLRAEFHCQVGRGALKQLQLNWPGYQTEGWQLESAFDSDQFQDWDLTEITSDGHFIINLLNRQSRKFKFVLQATRRIPTRNAEGEAEFALSLPEVPESVGVKRWASTDLIMSEASDLSVNLTPLNGTTITPFVLRDEERQEFDKDSRQDAFRMTSRSHRFEASVSEQKREIDATTSVVISLSGNIATVEQTLDFDVRYLRIDELLLNIPESLTGKVDVSFEGTRPPDLASSDTTRRRVPLSNPVLGRTQLIARYAVEMPDNPTTLQVPWVGCLDTEFSSVRIEVTDTGAVNCEPIDTVRWNQVFSTSGVRAWETTDFDNASQMNDAIEFKLDVDSSRAQHRYSVRQAIIQTAIDGSYTSLAQFRIVGNPHELELIVPPGCRFDWIKWKSEPIEPTSIKTVNNEQQITLTIPDTDQSNVNWLLVSFSSDATAKDTWYSHHDLVSPRFAEGVWIDETIWQVMVTGQQLLLNFGDDYSARYQWKRDKIVWQRQSDPVKGFNNLAMSGAPRSYTIGRLGSNVPLKIQTIHRSMSLLAGAGIALLLGFVLFLQPLTRGLMLIGFFAVALALASVVWPIPIEVFVQPAIVGMGLALTAAGIDQIGHRLANNGRSGIRLPKIDEMTFIPAKGNSDSFSATGSEDRTVVRTAPVVPISSGSETGAARS